MMGASGNTARHPYGISNRSHPCLEAAGNGAIMAGPVGTIPPKLMAVSDPPPRGGTTQPRAQGMARFVPESLAREKAKPTGYEENNHWLAARPQALRLWPVNLS
jgi:hypothetical protein